MRGGLVDYDAFAREPAFARYLARLAAFDPGTLPVADRLAFWINTYTIALIVKHDGTPASSGRFIARYFPPGAERSMPESGRFKLTFTEYDWRLNSTGTGR